MYPLLQEAFLGFRLLQARWSPPWSAPSSLSRPSLQPRPHWHALLFTVEPAVCGEVCSTSVLSTAPCVSQTSAECWSNSGLSFFDNQSHTECFRNTLLGPPAPQPETPGGTAVAERAGLVLVQQGALGWWGGALVRGAGKPGQAEGGPWEGAQGGLCCCKEAGGTVIGQLRGQV